MFTRFMIGTIGDIAMLLAPQCYGQVLTNIVSKLAITSVRCLNVLLLK